MNTKHQITEPLLKPIKVVFLTQVELAKELSVSRSTIYLWTRAGYIPSIKIGKRAVRYDLAEVRRHLNLISKRENIEQELA
jgi:excisionase family DNA binding protein